VVQQALGDAGDAGVAGLAPRLDPRPNLVDQRDFDKHAGVVKGLGAFGGDHVAGRATAVYQ
jgi:hypothetical protein